jgi:hypothetical protein
LATLEVLALLAGLETQAQLDQLDLLVKLD